MNFNYINKFLFVFFLILIYSCQDSVFIQRYEIEKNRNEDQQFDTNQINELDLKSKETSNNYAIDFYSSQKIQTDIKTSIINKLKINNFEKSNSYDYKLNVYFNNSYIYSINYKGEILKFNSQTGKLIQKSQIFFDSIDRNPVSFSLIDDDFIIGFKNGEIIRTSKNGIIKWRHKYDNFLNTPIKYYKNKLYVLYPDQIIILSLENGKVTFQKQYKSNNIIQSNGGKITNYFNIVYFILPNGTFHSIDTLLFDDHLSNLENLKLNNSLNNLNDQLHIYKDYLVYLDNGNTINTFDIIENKFLIKNVSLNETDSIIFYNNILVKKDDTYIKFFNIKNINLIKEININKLISKKSRLVKLLYINNILYLFTDNGEIVFFDKKLNILDKVDMKIRNINNIYNYQGKIFISTNKGFTYIF